MADRLPTVRTRKLGDELRKLRDTAQLTLEEAGQLFQRSRSALGRIEQGLKVLTPEEVDYILNAYGVTSGEYREALRTLAEGGMTKGWWSQYGRLPPAYAERVSLEQDTRRIRSFQSQAVTGLLQTPGYADTVLRSDPSEQPRDFDWSVDFRMARQRLLTKSHPAQLTTVLTEGVVRQRLGGTLVMREQLNRLVETRRQPNVTVQILPFEAESCPGINGPFEIWDLASSRLTVVVLDSLTRSLFLEENSEVRRYNIIFDELCAKALPEADSLALIERVAAAL